jgi:hypothetical protein
MNDEGDIIEAWEEWTDEVVTARHRCDQNQHDDIGILHRESGHSGPEGWILANMELATEEDVQSGRAPTLGDVERCTAILISFCPFCGSSLSFNR